MRENVSANSARLIPEAIRATDRRPDLRFFFFLDDSPKRGSIISRCACPRSVSSFRDTRYYRRFPRRNTRERANRRSNCRLASPSRKASTFGVHNCFCQITQITDNQSRSKTSSFDDEANHRGVAENVRRAATRGRLQTQRLQCLEF